jgi:hypothetical protein
MVKLRTDSVLASGGYSTGSFSIQILHKLKEKPSGCGGRGGGGVRTWCCMYVIVNGMLNYVLHVLLKINAVDSARVMGLVTKCSKI